MEFKNLDYEKLSAIIQQKIQENNDFIISKIEAVEERNSTKLTTESLVRTKKRTTSAADSSRNTRLGW